MASYVFVRLLTRHYIPHIHTHALSGPDPSYEAALRGVWIWEGLGGATAPEYLHGNRMESSIFHSAHCQRLRMNPVLIRESKPHHIPRGGFRY